MPPQFWLETQKRHTELYGGFSRWQSHEMGVPISVVIDDFLPINTSWGTNTYAWINTDKELWPVLIEKAFSKLMGNYETIEGGWPQ